MYGSIEFELKSIHLKSRTLFMIKVGALRRCIYSSTDPQIHTANAVSYYSIWVCRQCLKSQNAHHKYALGVSPAHGTPYQITIHWNFNPIII